RAVGGTFRRARPAVAWASAASLLAVGIAVGYAAHDVGDLGERRVSALVDEERLAEGSGTLIVSEEEKRAVLSVHGMPALPASDSNEIYQLWLVRGSEVIPSSLLSVGEDGSGTAAITSGVEDVDAVWVTREPAGGARAPSEPPVMRVSLD
ncbi:MAG TPA: anti-sigma factor, partial [Solirubrobacteraceae bacterium]|nr:anti-sigma factor [Solirubrobacteraceae bacterium]